MSQPFPPDFVFDPSTWQHLWDYFYLFLLAIARIVPIIALAPFLGGKMIGDVMKVGFGVALAAIFFPYLVTHQTAALTFNLAFIFLLIKEVFVGLLLGFLVSIPFHFFEGAGNLIEHQSGSQSLQVTDPSTQVQASPIGLLYNNVMVALFFSIGGPLLLFEGILTSYKVMPADRFLNPIFFSTHTPLAQSLFHILHNVMAFSLQLAAPPVMAMLMSDLFLGIINRMASQVQISFLLWSMKAYSGLLLIWAGWWIVIKQMESEGIAWMKMIDSVLRAMGKLWGST